MAGSPERCEDVLRNEEVLLQTKYEENDRITRRFTEVMDEMKSRMDEYGERGPTRAKRVPRPRPVGSSAEFDAFTRIVDRGGTVERFETVTSKEVTVKNSVLQKEVDRANAELARAEELCERLRADNRRLTEDRDGCAGHARRLTERARRRDAEAERLAAALKARDAEVARLLRELDAAEKRSRRERLADEKRAAERARAVDENARLADAVKRLEAARADADERHAKAAARAADALAKCAREKEALAAGFRKQLELIDALKRRHAVAALRDQTDGLHDEFGKLLESE